jgi:hypothetical protein
VSYTIGVIKPSLPVFLDIIAHTFQELEHTNTVHKHNGENHVHQEIAATEKDETNKNTNAPKIEVSVNPHLINKLRYNFSIEPSLRDLNSALQTYFPSTHIIIDYPPPKFC